MEARIITDRQQWNDFVAASVCCNITQSYEWGELAPHLGAEAMRIGVVRRRRKTLRRHARADLHALPCCNGSISTRRVGQSSMIQTSPVLTVAQFCQGRGAQTRRLHAQIEPSVADGDAGVADRTAQTRLSHHTLRQPCAPRMGAGYAARRKNLAGGYEREVALQYPPGGSQRASSCVAATVRPM